MVVISLLALTAAAQDKKEFTYNVGPRAVVSITNNYGPITVKPSGSRQVVVETVSHSDAVSLVNEQHGDRIELRSVSSRQGTDLVDYTVLVPVDAFVSLRSSDGTLRAQGLRGDVILEAAAASVEVTDISDAHLHVKTLSGPITLTDIRNSHLDIHSVSGNVNIRNVTGPSVEVNSGSGRISYQGDPGSGRRILAYQSFGRPRGLDSGQRFRGHQGTLHQGTVRSGVSDCKRFFRRRHRESVAEAWDGDSIPL